MPSVNSQGVRIHYQVAGEGPPRVLQHGFTDSLESWYEFGYVSALRQANRLILLDARGHGSSEKPHEPAAYEAQLHVADILAVLDALNIPTAHFCGYSMGGRIGFASAQYAPNRFSSFIIGGSQPYGRPHTPADPLLQMLRQGSEAIEWDAPLSPALKARVRMNDVEALIACRLQILEHPGFAEVLPTMTMPCLLFAGEADGAYSGVKECVKHLPNGTGFFLPGLKHAETFFRSDLVVPHLTQFLATVSSWRRRVQVSGSKRGKASWCWGVAGILLDGIARRSSPNAGRAADCLQPALALRLPAVADAQRSASSHEGSLYAKMYIMCYHLYLLLGMLISGVRPQQYSKEVIVMSSVEEIQSAIVSLPPEEYARLRAWFIERDWEQWDQQIAADAHAGKLDFLIAEAMAEKAQGHLRGL